MRTRAVAFVSLLRQRMTETLRGDFKPLAVDVYGGQLLNLDMVINPPRVFVEFKESDYRGLDIGNGTTQGSEEWELICVAGNGAGGVEHDHAGLELLEWVQKSILRWTLVDEDGVWQIKTITAERLAITPKLWIGVVKIQIRND